MLVYIVYFPAVCIVRLGIGVLVLVVRLKKYVSLNMLTGSGVGGVGQNPNPLFSNEVCGRCL